LRCKGKSTRAGSSGASEPTDEGGAAAVFVGVEGVGIEEAGVVVAAAAVVLGTGERISAVALAGAEVGGGGEERAPAEEFVEEIGAGSDGAGVGSLRDKKLAASRGRVACVICDKMYGKDD